MKCFGLFALTAILLTGCVHTPPAAKPPALETPVTLQLDFTWMAFEPEELTAHPSFKQEMRVTPAAVIDAMAADKGTLIGSQKLHAQSGVNSIVEMVDEILYPTEFDVTENDIEIQATVRGGESAPQPPTVIPGGFETREVGSIVNITPSVLKSGEIILELLIETAGLEDWEDFGSRIQKPDGSIQSSEMRQPIFSSQNITSRMEVPPGKPVVAFAGLNPKRGKIEVLIISAHPE
jgi:hypothetical protein